MQRVTLGHRDVFVVYHHPVAAVAATAEDALHHIAAVARTLVLAQSNLLNLFGGHQVVEQIQNVIAHRCLRATDAVGNLLVVERTLRISFQEIQHSLSHVGFSDSFIDGSFLLHYFRYLISLTTEPFFSFAARIFFL